MSCARAGSCHMHVCCNNRRLPSITGSIPPPRTHRHFGAEGLAMRCGEPSVQGACRRARAGKVRLQALLCSRGCQQRVQQQTQAAMHLEAMKRHAARRRHVDMPSLMTVYCLRRSAPARDPKSRMLARHRQLPSSRPPRLSMYSRSLASCSASMDCCGVAGQREQQSNMKWRVDGLPAAERQEAGGGTAGSEAPAGRSSLAARQRHAADEPQRLLPEAMGLASAAPAGAAAPLTTVAILPCFRSLLSYGGSAPSAPEIARARGLLDGEGKGVGGGRRGRRRGRGAAQGQLGAPPRRATCCTAAAPCAAAGQRGWGGSQGATAAGGRGDGGTARLWQQPGAPATLQSMQQVLGVRIQPPNASQSAHSPQLAILAACVKNRASRQSQAARDDCTILREAQGGRRPPLPACCRSCQRLHRRGMRPTRARLLIPPAPCYCDCHAPRFGYPGAPVRAAACHRPHRHRPHRCRSTRWVVMQVYRKMNGVMCTDK